MFKNIFLLQDFIIGSAVKAVHSDAELLDIISNLRDLGLSWFLSLSQWSQFIQDWILIAFSQTNSSYDPRSWISLTDASESTKLNNTDFYFLSCQPPCLIVCCASRFLTPGGKKKKMCIVGSMWTHFVAVPFVPSRCYLERWAIQHLWRYLLTH